jgi:hypothetical protein
VDVEELDTVPNVQVRLVDETVVLSCTTPPNAQPSLPLPPAPILAPGTPAPAYAVAMSIHPLALDVESINDPGKATHNPATLPA